MGECKHITGEGKKGREGKATGRKGKGKKRNEQGTEGQAPKEFQRREDMPHHEAKGET